MEELFNNLELANKNVTKCNHAIKAHLHQQFDSKIGTIAIEKLIEEVNLYCPKSNFGKDLYIWFITDYYKLLID